MKRPKWLRAEKRHRARWCPACKSHHAAMYRCRKAAQLETPECSHCSSEPCTT